MRFWTGKCELERICDRHPLFAPLPSSSSSPSAAAAAAAAAASSACSGGGSLARDLYLALRRSRQCAVDLARILPHANNSLVTVPPPVAALSKTAAVDCESESASPDATLDAPLIDADADIVAMRILARKRLSGRALPETALRQRLVFGLLQLVHFQRLRASVADVTRRRRAFDEANADDEALLESLWTLLRPDVRRRGGRVTDEWQELGFQGSNPATDFRGMGVLGLESLVHFARAHSSAARRVCNESLVPHNKWFSFAITHINLAYDVVHWCEREPELVTAVFMLHGPTIATFHEFVGAVGWR